MFVAIVTCAVAGCGLTGSFTVPREYVSISDCQQQTMTVIQAVGGNPSLFRISCKPKGK